MAMASPSSPAAAEGRGTGQRAPARNAARNRAQDQLGQRSERRLAVSRQCSRFPGGHVRVR
jgi:hypothetical protein